jgi:hypothetical protein
MIAIAVGSTQILHRVKNKVRGCDTACDIEPMMAHACWSYMLVVRGASSAKGLIDAQAFVCKAIM